MEKDKRISVVVVSGLFPWSPSVLGADFKLKVYMCDDSPLLNLAIDYYARFDIKVEGWKSLDRRILDCGYVVDEGRSYPIRVQHILARASREVIYIRVGALFSKGVPRCGLLLLTTLKLEG